MKLFVCAIMFLGLVSAVHGQGSTIFTTITGSATTIFGTTTTFFGPTTTVTGAPESSSSASSTESSSTAASPTSAAPSSASSAAPTSAAPSATPAPIPGANNTYPGVFSCILLGANEVPFVPSASNGTFFLDFSVGDGTYADWNLTISNIINPVSALLQYGGEGMIGPSVLSLFQLPAGIISAAVIDAAGTLGEAELLSAANQSPLRNFSSFGKAVETGLVYINVATSLKDPTFDDIGIEGNSPFGELRCQLAPHQSAPTRKRFARRMLPQMVPIF